MTFSDPRWLWTLAALPLIAGLEWLAARRAAARIERLIGARPEHSLLVQVRPAQRTLGVLLRLGAVAMLVLGAARPEWGREVVRRGATGSDVVLVIDVSASMDARDVPPSRLDEARREALAVIDRLAGSRIGVVAFAGDAIRLCPLTLDRAAVRLTVEGLSSLAVAEPGTDLGKGLRTALRLFPENSRDEQVMVLWTDGEDLEQGATNAVEDVVHSRARVFAIGVGTPAGDIVPVVDDRGRAVDIKRDENGVAVRSRLDDALLRQVARRTRGGWFAASRPGGELPRLLASLGTVASSGRGNRLIERPVARFTWFAAAAALLLALERSIARRRRRSARDEAPLASVEPRMAAAALMVMIALAGFSSHAAAQSPWARGDREFKAGRFTAAESLYTLRLKDKKAPPEVRVNRATARALGGHGPEGIQELEQLAAREDGAGRVAVYNQGTLLGDAKQYDPALAALRRALERDAADDDARWNYEVVLQRQEQERRRQNPQQQPKQAQPQPSQPRPQPSAPQNPGQPPQPQTGAPPAPQPQQGMDRAQAEQILNALEELQRMDQQRERKVRVLKERRGRDW